MAASINEMVEAHLLNVQRELEALNTRVVEMQAESNRLQAYLKEGQATLSIKTVKQGEWSDATPIQKPF
jgi:hypothetical protein